MARGGDFEKQLSDFLQEESEARSKSVLAGAPKDYAYYREQVGYISALHDVAAECRRISSGGQKQVQQEGDFYDVATQDGS